MVTKEQWRRLWRTRRTATLPDPAKQFIYDVPDTDEMGTDVVGLSPYPDWVESETFVVRGPVGETARYPGRRFSGWREALDYYVEKYGELPVEIMLIGARRGNRWVTNKQDSCYAFKFRRSVLERLKRGTEDSEAASTATEHAPCGQEEPGVPVPS